MDLTEIKKFISAQCDKWELCRENYSALANVETRLLYDADGRYVATLLHNPARIRSSAAPAPTERKCFLCRDNRPKEQDYITCRDYEILVNPFPIFPIHLTISHKNHIEQTIFENIKAMLEFCDLFPELTVFYNGPQCGASAPDHHHFQAADFTVDAELISDRCFSILSDDNEEIVKHFHAVYSSLPAQSPEPMMNILINQTSDGKKRLIIFPRKKHRPTCYGEYIISPASVEMSGFIVTPRREDFERLTAEKVKEIIEDVTLKPAEIR